MIRPALCPLLTPVWMYWELAISWILSVQVAVLLVCALLSPHQWFRNYVLCVVLWYQSTASFVWNPAPLVCTKGYTPTLPPYPVYCIQNLAKQLCIIGEVSNVFQCVPPDLLQSTRGPHTHNSKTAFTLVCRWLVRYIVYFSIAPLSPWSVAVNVWLNFMQKYLLLWFDGWWGMSYISTEDVHLPESKL